MKHTLNTNSQLDAFYSHIIKAVSRLLESQTRLQQFNQGIFQHTENELQKLAQASTSEQPETLAKHYQHIKDNLGILRNLQTKDDHTNFKYLQKLLVDTHELSECLSAAIIDKSLLERQTGVLKNIILSHEKVAEWKEFVMAILCEFHEFFPFNFFSIAFNDEKGVSIYIYCLGQYDKQTQEKASQYLAQDLTHQLGLPADAAVSLETFSVPISNHAIKTKDLKILTMDVPCDQGNLGGILGLGYASAYPLTPQEQSIIRSLLAVMVMVVGSSKALSRSLKKLTYYAEHDPLTGLHNRRYFEHLLKYEIDRSSRHGHQLTLLSIDLDNFKSINDINGHLAGDQVLSELAQILSHKARKGDIISRIGGDEFVILLPETDLESGNIVANAFRQKIAEHEFHISQHDEPLNVSISIGQSNFPLDGQSFQELLNKADIALYQAKTSGRNFVCTAAQSQVSVDEYKNMISLSTQLRKALKDQRIVPYFQPIIDCKNDNIYAYEALARLQAEDGEIIPAGLFIEAADRYNINIDLDHIMLKKTVEFMAQHQANHHSIPRVFINLTPQEIQSRQILNFAEQLCLENNIPSDRLVFEITEREAISDMINMREFLTIIRAKGFAFALDDFGSGYNSFHYLRELHFEYVKIDGAFVANILNSKIDLVLIENLVRICQQLGMKTLAEFVESEEIMKLLKLMGVDFAQGFHLGMPKQNFVTEVN